MRDLLAAPAPTTQHDHGAATNAFDVRAPFSGDALPARTTRDLEAFLSTRFGRLHRALSVSLTTSLAEGAEALPMVQ